eukprot:jgi/Hompol1/1854/HPOL_005749-RA
MNKTYVILILLVGFWSINVFIFLDLILFYISFESVLIPMYLLISYYGSRNKKIDAKNLLILYTLFGSLFLLISIIYLYIQTGTNDYEVILTIPINIDQQKILFLGFFISFAIKLPIFPFHIWLPQVHTEAPTSGSIILAAILLKLGSYGIIRYCLILFPNASLYYSTFIYLLGILSI